MRGNVGGAFVWDAGRVEVASTNLAGGTALALLVDGATASATARDSLIEGAVHADAGVWAGLRAGGNRLAANADEAKGEVGAWPPESGPFVFVADKYRRKQ